VNPISMKNGLFLYSWLLCVFILPKGAHAGEVPSDTTIERPTFFSPIFSTVTKKKPTTIKPTGDFDQRFEYIGSKPISIWGYRLGVLVNDRFKVGVGGYFYNQREMLGNTNKDGRAELATATHASFGTLYYEPYLFRKKMCEMSVVLEAGYGVIYTDTLGMQQDWSLRSHSIKSIFPVGAGLSANLIMPDIRGLHFLTYLGLNGMVGVRETPGSAGGGLYWSISSAIFIDRIFTDVKYGVRKK
jgi:hypothetical protein